MGHDTAEPRAGTTTADMQRWIKNANHVAQWIATSRRGLPGPVREFLAVDVPEMMRAIGRQAVELARLRDGDDAPLPRNAGPFVPNTRVTFGPDREPGTITEVVMRRTEGISYVEPGTDSVVVEPGARVWEYDVRADSDGRLVACQPRDVELLPFNLKAMKDEIDGGPALSGRILARGLAAELAYRLSEIEVLRGDVERLRAAVITGDEPGGGQ